MRAARATTMKFSEGFQRARQPKGDVSGRGGDKCRNKGEFGVGMPVPVNKCYRVCRCALTKRARGGAVESSRWYDSP
jgi:hypothetical protein